MTRVILTMVLATLAFPATTFAAGKDKAGAIFVLAGAGLMAGAFDYKGDQCPAGYTTHTAQNLPTQCFLVRSNGSTDIREATTGVTFKRKPMMWAGVGSVATGIVLFMLPSGAQNTVDISITPQGVAASKTFTFGSR